MPGENTECTENLEGFLCGLRVLRGETIAQAHTIIHSSFAFPLDTFSIPEKNSVHGAVYIAQLIKLSSKAVPFFYWRIR